MPVDLDDLEEIANGMAHLRDFDGARAIREAIAELCERREDQRVLRESIEWLKRQAAGLTWTRGKPTEPGRYEVRRYGFETHRFNSDGDLMVSYGRESPDESPVEYCGPLPEPTKEAT
jgi:hypothetical protein